MKTGFVSGYAVQGSDKEICHDCRDYTSEYVYGPRHEETTECVARCKKCNEKKAKAWDRMYS